jgi:TDG/mug DNA glycosylase family protein
LLKLGLGITNVVPRASARAEELSRAELVAGAEVLAQKARTFRPQWVAIVGVTAYRVGFGRPKAVVGRQDERIGGAGLRLPPDPSGLNTHFQLDRLAAEFAALRTEVPIVSQRR